MGQAEGVPNILDQKSNTVFLEDLSPRSKAKILKEKTGVFYYLKNINFFLIFIDSIALRLSKFGKYMLLEF